jgi:putative PIN family toxin of toxin-antitoxin system
VKRVVADTNVLVSAIQFGGKPKQLLDLAVDGHVDLAISDAILEETLRVLRDKFHRTTEQLRETDTQLRVVGRMVRPTESVNVVDADSTDNRILECAVAADAKAETEKPSPPLWTKGGKARAAKLTPGERKRARTRKCTVHFFRVQSRIRRNDSP